MRKDKLLKEWFEFNRKYWKALKLRSKLHGHLSNSTGLPDAVLADAEPVFVHQTSSSHAAFRCRLGPQPGRWGLFLPEMALA